MTPFPDERVRSLVGPFTGPCALCGWPDSRHRILDAISERAFAGESVEDIAADHHLTVEAVRRIVAQWHPDEEPDAPDDEPVTRLQAVVGALIVLALAGLVVGLWASGHGPAAFVVLLALGIAGTVAYLGASR